MPVVFTIFVFGSQDLQKVANLAQHLKVSFSWLMLGYDEPARDPVLADVFDEQSADDLSGYWQVRLIKLVPKKK